MDRELDRPGCNIDDQWRSHWIDCLVREQVLERQLVPHRHNPEDLVPVIKLCEDYQLKAAANHRTPSEQQEEDEEFRQSWEGISLAQLNEIESDTYDMAIRVIVSVEQFTSFRSFAWCPLGSLHRRLRPFDTGMAFQRAVEYLVENQAAEIKEYPNPQSNYFTKGISLTRQTPMVEMVLDQRDTFVRMLLQLYDRNVLISEQSMRAQDTLYGFDLPLWFSIMETENILNALPGRPGQYSLFRTHHTVNQVAGVEESAD
jgi:hypothetical protein